MLNMIKNLMDRHIFLRGEVSRSDLTALPIRDVLTDYLPYMHYSDKLMNDEGTEEVETRAFLNFDNTIGWIWELIPPPFIGGDTLDTLHGLVRTQFPKGTVTQWILYPDSNISRFTDEYDAVRNNDDPISAMNARQMKEWLEKGKKGVTKMANIPVRNFRLFFTVKCEERLTDDTLLRLEQGFTQAKMAPRRWTADDLLAFLAEFFNEEPSFPKYNPDNYLRRQFRSNRPAVEPGEDDNRGVIPRPLDDFSIYPARIGNRYMISLFPNEMPQEKNDPLTTNKLFGGFMGVEDDRSQLKYPFMYTLTVVYDDLREEIATKASRTMFQKVGAGLAHSLNERIKEFSLMQKTIAKSGRFAYMIPQLMVFGDSPKAARRAAADAITIWDQHDFKLMPETSPSMVKAMFLHGLPFGFYHIDSNLINLDRYYHIDYENLTRFLPVQGDFRGGGKAVQVYQGRKGQIITLDMFDKRANAHNFYVVAETGGGKSFLLNDLLDSYYSAGAKVRIVDIGSTYYKLIKMRKGRFIDFSVSNPICMNPLDFQYLDQEDLESNLSAAQIIFSSAAYSFTGKQVNETEAGLIYDACAAAIRQGDQYRGTDFIIDYLNSRAYTGSQEKLPDNIHETAANLAFQLRLFSSTGPYGRFMVGKSEFSIKDDDFVCADLEKLSSVKPLFFPMIMQLMNCVTQDLYLSDRSRPSFILTEEIASVVKDVGNISMHGYADMAEQGYRRARKYRGAFGVVIQSPLDLLQLGSLGAVVQSNAQWRYYLESKMYTAAARQGVLPGIEANDEFLIKLLNSLRNVRPLYGEFMVDCPMGVGVARLCVDNWRYWINTSDGADVAAFNQALDDGMEPVEALSRLSGVAIPDDIQKRLKALRESANAA